MYKEQKTAHWQWIGYLLVILYSSVTGLIAVPSSKTTGYVHVITAILDTEAADWPYWMRTTVLESSNMDSSKYTPKVPYGSSFTTTRTAKGSPDVPMLLLTSSWEWCNRASDCPPYHHPLGQRFEKRISCCRLKQLSNLAPLNLICWMSRDQLQNILNTLCWLHVL